MNRLLLRLFFGNALGVVGALAHAQPVNPNFYHLNSDEGLVSDQTLVLAQDYQGFLWLGTEEGLSRFSYTKFHNYYPDRDDSTTLVGTRILALMEDKGRRMWVGTDQGVSRYVRSQDHFETIPLASHAAYTTPWSVQDFCQDSSGTIWLASDRGLARYQEDEQQFVLIGPDSSRELGENFPLHSLALGPDQALWMTRGPMLIRYRAGLYDSIRLKTQGATLTEMVFDDQGDLWVGSRGSGLFRVNPHTGETEQFLPQDDVYSLAHREINALHFSSSGALWVGTPNGLSVLWPETDRFITYQHDINDSWGLSDYVVTDIFEDLEHGIWIATEAGGLTYYHEADNLFEYYGPQSVTGKGQGLLDYHVRSLFEDKHGALWFGSRLGLTEYHREAGRFFHHPVNSDGTEQIQLPIQDIIDGGNDRFWLGTTEGLARYNLRTERYEVFSHGEADYMAAAASKVNDLWLDNQQQLWLATEQQGLVVFDTRYEQFLSEPLEEGQSNPTAALYVLLPDPNKNGLLYIGGQQGLFLKPPGQANYEPVQLKENGEALAVPPAIQALALDSLGYLWAGTQQSGLWRIHPETFEVRIYGPEHALNPQDVRALVFDDMGQLWVTTNSGLFRLTNPLSKGKQTFSRYSISDGIQGRHFFARAGLNSGQGEVYLGGVNGLTVFDPSRIRTFETPVPIVISGLKVGDQEIKMGDDTGLMPKAIALMDTLMLGPDQNNFTLEFTSLDFLRPYDITYQYMLEGYDQGWQDGGEEPFATYTNLRRGRYYNFRVRSTTPKGRWTEANSLIIYLAPAFWETLLFRAAMVVFVMILIFLGYQLRTVSIRRKNARLARMVEESTKQLQAEINERIRTEHALTRAKDAAEIANRVKSEFLANMSHEIRTPLNGIIGLTGLVLATPLNKDQSSYLHHVKQSADSLLRMIDDLLDFARLEAGQFRFVEEPFSLQDVLDEVIAGFRYEARQNKIRLDQALDDRLPKQLIGDKGRIQQVLLNLMANAFKFTEKGTIRVDIEQSTRPTAMDRVGVQFAVADTGIGIAEAKLQEIFDDFTQADNTTTRKYGGTGLGLALCRELVHHMGGEIWVESKEKEGSTFYFFLPLRELGTPITPKVQKTDHSLIKPLVFKPYHLLVVEDNAVNQLVITRLLKKVGLSVDVAHHGKHALDMLEQTDYAMVLMDLHMPEMDGYEAARRIRTGQVKARDVQNIPIVAVTAAARKVDEDRCRNLGMNDFLTKPVNAQLLYEVLRKWLPEDSTKE